MSKEIDKLKLEIKQKDIMIEALKNAIGNILQGEKCCEEIKGGTTIRINLIKEKEKRIENALLYLKTMEETEDTYELEKILKGE